MVGDMGSVNEEVEEDGERGGEEVGVKGGGRRERRGRGRERARVVGAGGGGRHVKKAGMEMSGWVEAVVWRTSLTMERIAVGSPVG